MTGAHHRADEAQPARAARSRLAGIPVFNGFTIGAYGRPGKRLSRQVAACRVEDVPPEDDRRVPLTLKRRGARWSRPPRWALRSGIRAEQLRRQNAGRSLRQEESAEAQRCEDNRSRESSFAWSCHRWLLEQPPCRVGDTKTIVISCPQEQSAPGCVDNVTGLIPRN